MSKTLDGVARVSLVEKKSRLLSLDDVHQVPATAFEELDHTRILAFVHGDDLFESIIFANRHVTAFDNTARREHAVDCLDDLLAQLIKSRGRQLKHTYVCIQIDDQPRNAIRLTKACAITGRICSLSESQ